MRGFVVFLLLAGCATDETVTRFAGEGSVWSYQDTSVGSAVPVTLTFPEPGQVAGQGPCNRYSATQTAPYPWFELGPVAATKRACPELAAEAAYFEDLQSMSLAEVSGDVLILSNDTGKQMVFSRVADTGSDR
ncbi:MAG: META domain-containing protein [Pseudomonadota bacterium]